VPGTAHVTRLHQRLRRRDRVVRKPDLGRLRGAARDARLYERMRSRNRALQRRALGSLRSTHGYFALRQRLRCRRGDLPQRALGSLQSKLTAVVRDFSDEHPDFELGVLGDFSEKGIVARELGPDDRPVYAAPPGSRSTSGRANFDQWYRDVPGVNARTHIDLQLENSPDTPGLFVYRDLEFFPIDGREGGNEGRNHNYHFTLEARTTFRYIGGEIFRFSGDDDFWVFINRRLAIDLGGLHEAQTDTVDLDSAASELGIRRGETYPLHFFFAERHTVESQFVIETSIAEPGSCN
jgi:fibro-slime domain-containing protein